MQNERFHVVVCLLLFVEWVREKFGTKKGKTRIAVKTMEHHEQLENHYKTNDYPSLYEFPCSFFPSLDDFMFSNIFPVVCFWLLVELVREKFETKTRKS